MDNVRKKRWEQSESDAAKLLRFAVELLYSHVRSRAECKSWGELTLVLSFQRGELKQVETIDRTPIRAELLGPSTSSTTTS